MKNKETAQHCVAFFNSIYSKEHVYCFWEKLWRHFSLLFKHKILVRINKFLINIEQLQHLPEKYFFYSTSRVSKILCNVFKKWRAFSQSLKFSWQGGDKYLDRRCSRIKKYITRKTLQINLCLTDGMKSRHVIYKPL